jgi:hypothetical protein
MIVHRIKCELADSFDDKWNDPNFRWLEGWTAKSDLTLQINDSAGVSPSASYTQFFKNAFNRAAGSTSLTSTVIAAVNQSFTITAGANYSEQAQRAETVSFTVSLREMRDWKRRTEREYGAAAAQFFCSTNEKELRGHLGLKEWIDSALYPVATGQLQAGIHPSPIGTPSKATAPPTKKLEFVHNIPADEARRRVNKAYETAATSLEDIQKSQEKVHTSFDKIQMAKKVYIDPFFDVLTPDLKSAVSHDLQTLDKIVRNVNEQVAETKKLLDEIKGIKAKADAAAEEFPETQVQLAEQDQSEADTNKQNAKKDEVTASKIEKMLTAFKPNPPIDGLLHSLQFIVMYGGSVTPNWSLLLWKGPGLTVPGALLSGTRTHVLNIALGSPGEQNRLIQNITVSNLTTR